MVAQPVLDLDKEIESGEVDVWDRLSLHAGGQELLHTNVDH